MTNDDIADAVETITMALDLRLTAASRRMVLEDLANLSRAAMRGHGMPDAAVVAGETGAPSSEGRESAPSHFTLWRNVSWTAFEQVTLGEDESALATCVIRGCGVVATRYGTHCRRHQAQIDGMANRED
jgi:hypothetical protein